jgi:hypothetical protein
MQDIPYLYHSAQGRIGVSRRIAVETLAEAILTLPTEAAVIETPVFFKALELARPRLDALAPRYKRVTWWAGLNT